jgi:LuxR family maltose regulon positive regulatory protein
MAIPVLQTKLHIPFLRSNLVPRPRLIEHLNAGLGQRLILISAPAGYGKTTLIVEWLLSTKMPAAWVSLDEGDNDPIRFFEYCVSAIQIIFPEVGKTTLVMLQSPQRPAIEALLSLLINDLVGMSHPFFLVLDDYHVIQAQPIHDTITFLLDHLPAQMHLVIGTRADPPLPISRLRARGQLSELRLSDLRFNTEEAIEFLNRTMGFSLAAQELAPLVTRAEGWAAGLQMAALALQAQVSIQGIEALPGFIRSFTGSNRFILDYLMEEVLQRQPETIQEFLLQTCILERLCGPLCDALLKDDISSETPYPSSSVLEHLDRSNLFIVPLDDQRQWYRYHHLFSDLLNQRLLQSHPDRVTVLHCRASAWFEQNGWINEAIEHSLAAQDYERAAELIAQAAEPTLMRSEVVTYMHWVERLPGAILQSQPRLIVFQAWGLLFAGYSKEKIEAYLSSLGSQVESPLTAPIRGYMALFQGKIGLSIELLRLALELLPESEHFLRGLAAICLANAYLSEYEVTTGVRTLEEVAQESQRTGNAMLAVLVYSNLAELSRKLGQLHKAQDYYLQAIELATDVQGRRLPVASRPLAGLGDLKREWNDLGTAAQYLTEAIALSRYWMQAGFIYFAPPLIRVRMAQGAWEEAQKTILQARKSAAEFSITQIDDYLVEMHQAWFWVVRGDLSEAVRWVERCNIKESIDILPSSGAEAYNIFHMRKYEQLILARLYLAQNEPAEALCLLETLLPKFEKIGRMVQVIEIKILRSLAWQALGRMDEALAELKYALTLAEPEGYIRLFLDEGNQILSLLQKIKVEDEGLKAYIQKLMAGFGDGSKFPGLSIASLPRGSSIQPSSFEPLSNREREVLRFLSGKLSAGEIADDLFVSVHTVRSHLKSIYIKLDVHSRLEAVEKAKELKLL